MFHSDKDTRVSTHHGFQMPIWPENQAETLHQPYTLRPTPARPTEEFKLKPALSSPSPKANLPAS
jgi:hypothetical protein